jgi:hypothetical protein
MTVFVVAVVLYLVLRFLYVFSQRRAVYRRVNTLRDMFRHDGREDLADDDDHVAEIMRSGQEDEYLHPGQLTKEENQTLSALRSSTCDPSISDEQREKIWKEVLAYEEVLEGRGRTITKLGILPNVPPSQ